MPPLEIADQFCGAGGSSTGAIQAAEALGLDVNLTAINHWDVAIATHSTNHVKARHLCMNMDSVDPRTLYPGGRIHLLVASPECTHFSNARGGKPVSDQKRASCWHVVRWAEALYIDNILVENVPEFCFPEEAAVLSKRGVVPIGNLQVGDEVWTHNARWKPVTRISRRRSNTVRVKGYGNSIIEPTPNHEFYVRQFAPRITQSGKYGRHELRLLEPEWVRADHLSDKDESSAYSLKYSGYSWATPSDLPKYWMRMPDSLGVDTSSAEFFYMIGRWLGDGYFRKRKSRTDQDLVNICANKNESDDLEQRLSETGLQWHRDNHSKSVDVFHLDVKSSRILIPWMRNNFGEYAHSKTLPAWVFGATEVQRWALIEGYHDSDGHEQDNGKMACVTVSRCLAVGIRLLLNSLGVPASISKVDAREARGVTNPEVKMQCRETYSVSWSRETIWEKCFRSELHFWGRIREVEPGRDDVEVVDIEVADDHSFIADGQVVHNCTYGPLGVNGRPIERRKGELFHSFITALKALDYNVEYRVLCAADYGDATTRERLFIQARRGKNRKISWPEPTHAPKDKTSTLFGELQPWRAAREIIDWEKPGKSIFGRKKPLADNTIERIMAGMEKFKWPEPFLVILRNNQNAQSVDAPLPTITAGGNHVGLCEPFIVPFFGEAKGQKPRTHSIDDPLPTVTSHGAGGLVSPFLIEYRGNHSGKKDSKKRTRGVDQPLPTQDTSNRFGLVQPFMIPQQSGGSPRSTNDPIPTISAKGAISLIEPFILPLNRAKDNPRSVEEPLRTVTATSSDMGLVEPFIMPVNHGKGDNRAYSLDNPVPTVTAFDALGFVEPFITKYYGTAKAVSVEDPLDTITAKDRFGVVTPFVIETPEGTFGIDVRFRMLEPHELAGAMGFPPDYVFTGSREEKVRMIGNAVAVNLFQRLSTEILSGYVRSDGKQKQGKVA